MKTILILLLLISAASAKDLNITDQEQTAIQQICDIASTNPNISRDIRANVAQFCVVWQKKMTEAPNNIQADPPPPKEK